MFMYVCMQNRVKLLLTFNYLCEVGPIANKGVSFCQELLMKNYELVKISNNLPLHFISRILVKKMHESMSLIADVKKNPLNFKMPVISKNSSKDISIPCNMWQKLFILKRKTTKGGL